MIFCCNILALSRHLAVHSAPVSCGILTCFVAVVARIAHFCFPAQAATPTKAGAGAGAGAGTEAGLNYKIIDMPTCCCSLGLGLGLESKLVDESGTCSLLSCQSIVCENFAMKLHSFAPDQQLK